MSEKAREAAVAAAAATAATAAAVAATVRGAPEARFLPAKTREQRKASPTSPRTRPVVRAASSSQSHIQKRQTKHAKTRGGRSKGRLRRKRGGDE